jgi:hypothetical protein
MKVFELIKQLEKADQGSTVHLSIDMSTNSDATAQDRAFSEDVIEVMIDHSGVHLLAEAGWLNY